MPGTGGCADGAKAIDVSMACVCSISGRPWPGLWRLRSMRRQRQSRASFRRRQELGVVSSIPRLIVSICRPASSPIRRRRAADRLWCLVPSRSLLLVHPESRAKTRCVDDRQSARNLWVSDGRLFSAPKPRNQGRTTGRSSRLHRWRRRPHDSFSTSPLRWSNQAELFRNISTIRDVRLLRSSMFWFLVVVEVLVCVLGD